MIAVWILSYLAVFLIGVLATIGIFILVINHVEKKESMPESNCSEDCICKTVPLP